VSLEPTHRHAMICSLFRMYRFAMNRPIEKSPRRGTSLLSARSSGARGSPPSLTTTVFYSSPAWSKALRRQARRKRETLTVSDRRRAVPDRGIWQVSHLSIAARASSFGRSARRLCPCTLTFLLFTVRGLHADLNSPQKLTRVYAPGNPHQLGRVVQVTTAIVERRHPACRPSTGARVAGH
jgi:hypothetical protein